MGTSFPIVLEFIQILEVVFKMNPGKHWSHEGDYLLVS